ncbi:MAG: glycosyltransferase family 39 protein [Eubacteriales bacterium]|nr:glycosyltransferase family 39 protein [Eubacteriales bacterium]
MLPIKSKLKSSSITVLIIIIFVIILSIGFVNHPNYGISADEFACHYRALVNANYMTELVGLNDLIKEPLPELVDYEDKDHGAVFDLMALGVQWILGQNDFQEIFVFKHFLNYLVFWLSLIAMYFMAKRRFNSRIFGLVSVLFLVLSPRIFADAFYNAKDLVFMSFFLMAMNSAMDFLYRSTWQRVLSLSFFAALAIATRTMGIVLVPTIWLIILLKAYREKSYRRTIIGHTTLFTLGTFALTILFWPALWHNPIGNFIDSFSNLSQFIRWEKNILLAGNAYLSSDLPWFYIPVWIAVTTPLLYLALFFTGIAAQIKRLIFDLKLKIWHDNNTLQDVFFLLLFFGPILSVIILNSILYDGWRHLYFVYPAFLMIALTGIDAIFRLTLSKKYQTERSKKLSKVIRSTLISVVVISLMLTGFWMYRANPLQNVYFNVLAGDEWRTNYDLDYWGLSNREALERIVATDPAKKIQIASISTSSVRQSFRIINPDDRKRVQMIDFNEINYSTPSEKRPPVYIFNNYKQLSTPDILDQDPRYEIFYQKLVDQELILTVYKLK